MNFNELAKARRSIRGFLPRAVEKETVLELLEAARYAPSAGNCQPWHFYVVSDKQIIQKIHQLSCKQDFLLTAPVIFIVCADFPRTEKRYAQRGRSLYCIQDTAAAIQNLLLRAKSLGLGTCWCGAFNEEALSQIIGIGEDMRPVAIIPAGYPVAEPAAPSSRRPIEEFATFIGEY